MSAFRFIPAALPLLLVLSGCSGGSQPAASDPAPEPVSAQSAFGGMFASARSWAADVQPLRVSQIDVDGAKAEGGKSPAWEAVFVSRSTGRVRRFTYSVVHRPARNLRRGVEAEPPQAWSGGSGSEPFNVLAFRKDSTVAFKMAMDKGREYAAKHPKEPVKCLLEKTGRFPDPSWRIYWGDSVSTSAFSVFMDATTGDFLGTSR
jgi:hypothetical protein